MTIPDRLVTTYLHMTSPDELRPAYSENAQLSVHQLVKPDAAFYRFLYREVGEIWRWRDRLLLSEEELVKVLLKPGLRIDVLYVGGAPAGFIETQPEGDSTEVAYFGLRTPYFGQGFGKHLLSYGVARAWEAGAGRIWLHTCNLDSPHALANYQARGFSVYEVKEEPMPARYR